MQTLPRATCRATRAAYDYRNVIDAAVDRFWVQLTRVVCATARDLEQRHGDALNFGEIMWAGAFR